MGSITKLIRKDKLKTQDILNEREKTHGDYKAVSEAWCGLTTAFDEHYSDSCVVLEDWQAAAIKMIFLKIARIVCGDPNFADHWDDIAGYAMLGRGKKEGHLFSCRNGYAPCECPNKERKYFSDTAGGLETIMTVDYCYECNKMHIVDCEQKEAEKSATHQEDYWKDIFINKIKDEFDFVGKRFDLMVDWLKNISENLVKLNNSKSNADVCSKCGCETNAYYEQRGEKYCEDCFTLDEIQKSKNSTSSKMEHVQEENPKCSECGKVLYAASVVKLPCIGQEKFLCFGCAGLTFKECPEEKNNVGTIEFYVAGHNEIYVDFKGCQIWGQSIDEQIQDLFKYYGKLTGALGLALPLLGYGPVDVKLYIPKGLFDIWVNLPITKHSTMNFIDYVKVNHFMSVIPYESLDGVFPKYYAQFAYEEPSMEDVGMGQEKKWWCTGCGGEMVGEQNLGSAIFSPELDMLIYNCKSCRAQMMNVPRETITGGF